MESWITKICLNFRPEWPRTFAPLFLNYNNWYLINVLYSTNARNRKNIVLQASSQLFVEAFDFRHKRKGDLGGCAINFLVYRYLLQAHWKTFLARNGKNSLEVRVATLSRLSVPLISHHCDVQPSSCQFLQKRVSSISRQTFIYSAPVQPKTNSWTTNLRQSQLKFDCTQCFQYIFKFGENMFGFCHPFKLNSHLQWSLENNDMNDIDKANLASCLPADLISKYLSERKRFFFRRKLKK